MKSIKWFFIISLIIGNVLAVSVASTYGFYVLRSQLNELFDQHLVDEYAVIKNLVYRFQSSDQYNSPIRYRQIHENIMQNELDHLRVSIWRIEGVNQKEMMFESHKDFTVRSYQGFQNIQHDNTLWRAYTSYDENSKVWITIADRFEDRFEDLINVLMQMAAILALGLGLMIILIIIIVSFGLKPLRELSKQLSRKQANDLSPVIVRSNPDEIQELIITLNQLFSRLTESFNREKQFVADAAHELRTPVAGIQVNLHNILDELHRPFESATRLKKGVDRLCHVLEQILTLNRIVPETALRKQKVMDLKHIAEDVVSALYPLISQKHHEIELQADSELICGDEFSIDTLMNNIINNAIKYTPPNGKILVSIHRIDTYIDFTVEDSGPGISKEEMPKIFSRFYRIGGDRHQSKETGCGLGMSIVKRIADSHKATISLSHSRFISGLKVTVKFPVDT